VLNTDDPLLAGLASDLRDAGHDVVCCSTSDIAADVALVGLPGGELHLYRDGSDLGVAVLPADDRSIALGNVACAIGAALSFGCPVEEVLARLGTLPVAENRLQIRQGTGGAAILDDTFNSNPAGAALALSTLAAMSAERRMLVTPGMVELGARQFEENERFSYGAAGIVDEIVVVARTNRKALLAGLARAKADGRDPIVHVVGNREQATAIVRKRFGPAHVVLYENDLPDHFP
jgi:UDP-N-acetylmuramoyl-tripeptide--D-alanyl-D-alanine ligase